MFGRLCKTALEPNRTYLRRKAHQGLTFTHQRTESTTARAGSKLPIFQPNEGVSKVRKSPKKRVPSQGSSKHAAPKSSRTVAKATKALGALRAMIDSSTDASQDYIAMAQVAGLPLSPAMDPNLIKNRARWKQRKLPSAPTTPFEKDIAANPFALMLSTPIRSCAISSTRVPSAFLRPFTLCKDPSGNPIWQLPKDLDPSPLETVGPHDSLKARSTEDSAKGPTSQKPPLLNTSLPACWVSSSSQAMAYMAGSTARKHNNGRVTTPRWRIFLTISQTDRIRAKENNAEMILDLLQKRCVRELAALVGGDGHGYSASVVPWIRNREDAGSVTGGIESALSPTSPEDENESQSPTTAALLWLGDQTSPRQFSTEMRERLFGAREDPIPRPIIRMSTKRVIPVIDGEDLLGTKYLQWLRDSNDIFNHSALIIKTTPASRNALRWIWTLNLY